jgi:hypothetical protein
VKKYADIVLLNTAGQLSPAKGANVTVLNHVSQTNATIFLDDSLTPSPNPVIADTNGRYFFYVADGRYDLKFTGTSAVPFVPFTIPDIEISDVTEDVLPGDATWNVGAANFFGPAVFSAGLTDSQLIAGNCVQATTGGLLTSAAGPCGLSSGTLTATGSPVAGNLTKWSGMASVTNADLTGDVTTSGTTLTTLATTIGGAHTFTGQITFNQTPVFPGSGLGSVTSVGLALPTQFTITGSPVTTAGTLTGGWSPEPPGTVLSVVAGSVYDHGSVNTGNGTLLTITDAPLSTPEIAMVFPAIQLGTTNSPGAGWTQVPTYPIWWQLLNNTTPLNVAQTTSVSTLWAETIGFFGSNGTTPAFTTRFSGSRSNGTFSSGAFTPIAGETILVFLRFRSTGGFFSSPCAYSLSDTAGNTYVQVGSGTNIVSGNGAQSLVFMAQNVAAVSTNITMTQVSGPPPANISLDYYIPTVTNTVSSNTSLPVFAPLTQSQLPAPFSTIVIKSGITTTTTCPTASAAGSTCTFTLTWATPFSDSNYAVSCTGSGTVTGFPFIQGVAKTTTTAIVTVVNGTANEGVVSGYTEMDCIGVHA